MQKSILRMGVLSLLAAAISMAPVQAFAQAKEKKEKPGEAVSAAKKAGVIPFRGKLAAIDKTAKTITVGQRTFQITSETRITKASKPATLDDGVVGEEVAGSYRKAEDGQLLAHSVRFGPKPEPQEGAPGKRKGQPKE